MDGVGLGTAGGARSDFGAFVTGHCREVGLLALRLCGKRDVAEEIAADAFAEVWRRWDELTRPGAAPADAMGEIVQRLVHERADRADRADRAGRAAAQPGRHSAAPRGVDAEPDSVRVRALLAERLALIPSQDARTVVIARIVEPVEDEPTKSGLGAKLRRPAPIAGAVVAVLVVAVGAYAMSGSGSGGKSAQTNQPLVPLGSTGGDALAAGASASTSTSTSASARPSPSISASASATPSASPSASASAAASASVAASASAISTTASSPTLVTASSSVYDQGHNSTWTQLDIAASVKQTLSALTITFTIADCPGLNAAGAWDSGAGGAFRETTTTNRDGSVTYVFQLSSGDQVSPGTINFAAQFSHQSSSWEASADSYSIVAKAAGSSATNTLTGSF